MNSQSARSFARPSVLVLTLVLAVSCEESTPSEPDVNMMLVEPTDGAFEQPLNVRLTWETLAGAVTYGVHLGSSAESLSRVASGLEESTFRFDEQLAANHEYFWRVTAESGDRRWRSPVWRFITINPDYPEPTSPDAIRLTLMKLWKARHVVAFDSLLADDYVYVASTDERDEMRQETLTREEHLRAVSALFRSPSTLLTDLGTCNDDLSEFVSRPSEDPRYPASAGYHEIIYGCVSFDLMRQEDPWRRFYIQPTRRDPTGNSGMVFFLQPRWRTRTGEDVWKITRIESYYLPGSFTPPGFEDVRYLVRSFGYLMRVGLVEAGADGSRSPAGR